MHSAKGDWQSKASEHTFVLQAFGAEETLYLDLKDQQSIELDQFTQLFNQQIFKLDHLPTIEEGDFEKLVDKAIQQIDEGLLQKVVLARQQFYPTDTNPLILFKAICAAYDNCFVHLIYEPNGKCSIGASPELLLSNNHEGIKSVSMAGTIIDGSSEFTSKEEEEQAFVTQYITAQFESMGFQPQIHDHSIENNNVTHLYSTIETSKKVDAEKADELLKKLHPIKVVIATVTGNIAQVLMTYGIGLSCMVVMAFFGDYGSVWQEFNKVWMLVMVMVLICLLIFFIQPLLRWLKPRIPKKITKAFKLIKKYDRKLFARVVAIAFIRYTVFAFQFFLLLQLFSNFSLPVYTIALIPIAYVMQSVAPVPAISDIGVRVFVTTLLFGSLLSDNAILHAVTCLWFINLILPGLIGTIYLVSSTVRNK